MAISIIHLSDLHFGAHDQRQADVLMDQIHELAPDLVVASGDFSYHARRREFVAARMWLDRLPCPWHAVPGNHDSPELNQLWLRVFDPWRRYRQILRADLETEFELEGVSVLGLNSSRPIQPRLDWSEGRLSKKQLERLRNWASACRDDGLRILSVHHPLARPEGNERALLRPAAKIRAVLGQARVDLVLSGHFHQPLIAVLKCAGFDPLLSLASTAISRRLKGEPNGFQRIDYDPERPDQLQLEGWTWQGARFRAMRRVQASRSDSGWQIDSRDSLAAEGPAEVRVQKRPRQEPG